MAEEIEHTDLAHVTSKKKDLRKEDDNDIGPKVSGVDNVRFNTKTDTEANLEAKIKNPLHGIPREQLLADVVEWAHRKNLTEHMLILQKGALVAQTPNDAAHLTGDYALTAAELYHLKRETTHRWALPRRLILTIAVCSIGAAVQGWDQTGSNGANIFFPKVFGIGSESTRDKLLVGLVNAGPYLGSAFIGCWLSDPINNLFGRRGVIFLAAHLCIWPTIGSAFCQKWQHFLACRILMGIGMGVKGSTVPIYAAENAPAAVRGALVMSWQMWTAFGIFLGTAFNLGIFHLEGDMNWRLMLGAPCIPAIILMLLIYFCPESPRWYMKKNRYPDAWKAMLKLRHDPIQVARDMYYISCQLEIEEHLTGKTTYATRLTQLFTAPRVRRATLAAFTVMVAQQMCAMIGSFGFGLVNWLFSFPAFWTIDTFGRRSLLLFTFPQMTWTLLAAGLCTLISKDTGDLRTALICLFVFLFCAFYSPGAGPVPFTYAAEVFPLSHRETGMGFAVATCFFWATVLGISFPFVLERLQTVGAFGLYAVFNLIAFIMIFFWVPETKQRTLEELDWVFAVTTGKFASYQLRVALPYWLKRWVLLRKDTTKKPLYEFEIVDGTGISEAKGSTERA
ncbi:major facilitator superfamily domain-containing protein [Fusarium flagelliforme]|uniref:major facilitator superfamily domain-containing protein n=1 Tax=Fusarium flagelliforme TaxID=2675880 RepID=UPI001E8D7EE4